jgi:hypothetical protein
MKPVRYEARKLQSLLGPQQMTSYDAGIGQTPQKRTSSYYLGVIHYEVVETI